MFLVWVLILETPLANVPVVRPKLVYQKRGFLIRVKKEACTTEVGYIQAILGKLEAMSRDKKSRGF